MSDNTIIIPLGEECYTCQSIDGKFSKSIRKFGLPFDYVGHVYVEKIYENFVDIFDLSHNYNICINDFKPELFGDKYYFQHNKYDFKYWHDISSNDGKFTENEMASFIDKYNRRYKRLYDTITSNDSIIFLSVNHFDNIYNKVNKQPDILKLFNFLYSINNNINFIAINYSDDLYNLPNLKLINLPVDTTITFMESKEIFTQQLYNYVHANL